jgi:hypothetical protein
MPIRSLNGVDMGIRSLNGLDNINPISATLPLEINDSVISLKGLNNIGSASQIIRVNSGATGLEYHTLEVVDLNSVQTLTNKTLSTNCSYTGNVISKTFLDNSLVDLTTGQVVQNKNLRNCSLNYQSNQITLIGSFNQQVYIDGTLNINQNNARGVIRFANDDNNSIYLRQNLLNANCMAFYSFNDFKFYSGNNTNINQANMPLRFAISHTAISMLVNTIVNGTLSVSSTLTSGDLTATSLNSKTVNVFKNNDSGLVEIFKSNVDSSNNNGTAKLKFTIDNINTSAGSSVLTNICEMGILGNTQLFTLKNPVNDIEFIAQTNINLKKNDNTPINLNFYKGTNFTSLVANDALSSNITVKLPTIGGTLALLADVPNISATSPIIFSNDTISIGGLTGFGLANQVIQVNSSGNGFQYGNLPNFSTLILSATDISTSSILFNPPTNIGSSSRNVNITSALMFLNANGANIKFLNNNVEKMAISATVVLVKNKQLITNSGTSIVSDSQLQVNNSALSKLLISSESGDCELAFQTINSSTTHTASIFYRNNDRGLDLTGFQQYNFQVGTNDKLNITDTLTLSKNKILVSSTNSSLDAINPNMEIHQASGNCNFLVNSGNAIAKLFLKSGSNFGTIDFTNVGEKLTTTGIKVFDFSVYDGNVTNNTKLEINNTTMTVNTNVFILSGNGGFNFDTTRTSGNSTFGATAYSGGYEFINSKNKLEFPNSVNSFSPNNSGNVWCPLLMLNSNVISNVGGGGILNTGGNQRHYGFCIEETNNSFRALGLLANNSNSSSVNVDSDWDIIGFFKPEANHNSFSFTASHRCVSTDKTLYDMRYVGLIVESTGVYQGLTSDYGKVSIDDAVPQVRLASKKKSKSILGVISKLEDDSEKSRTGMEFGYVAVYKKDLNRIYVNSIGEGGIWIVNTNGNLENGDYIQSSNIAGYGEKQDDDILHNYTVAKITCDCNFDNISSLFTTRNIENNIAVFVGVTYHCG